MVLDLHGRIWAFSGCSKRGLLFVAVGGLLTAVVSLVVEHRLWVCEFQELKHVGSVVVAHRFGCFVACGIFPDQGLDPCPLH